MKFCPNCGSPASSPSAKFCAECGYSFLPSSQGRTIEKNLYSERTSPLERTISSRAYSEALTVCPHCGAPISSDSPICSSCGRERVNTYYSIACQELCDRLDAIEASRPAETVLSTLSRIVDKAMDKTRLQPTDQRKIELISGYIVPNTRADMIAFLILADSRAALSRQLANQANDDYVSNAQTQLAHAWSTKYEQVLKQASVSLPNDPIIIRAKYRASGLCQYCGGTFRGLFKKVCSRCGKPKDYDVTRGLT